jgi:S4 domain protein YaaA
MEKSQPIYIEGDYITLGQFLKFVHIISNGGKAKFFLLENVVSVNEINEKRRGRKLRHNDIVIVNDQQFLIQNKGQ